MKISSIASQPNFQAVNQKYLKKAEKSYKWFGNVNSEWYDSILYDTVLWKEISIQDAVDTMMAVKKYVNEGSMAAFDHVLNRIKQG